MMSINEARSATEQLNAQLIKTEMYDDCLYYVDYKYEEKTADESKRLPKQKVLEQEQQRRIILED